MDGYGEESYPAKVSMTPRLGLSKLNLSNSGRVGEAQGALLCKAEEVQKSGALKAEVLVTKIL